jgi:hypothetical protein
MFIGFVFATLGYENCTVIPALPEYALAEKVRATFLPWFRFRMVWG